MNRSTLVFGIVMLLLLLSVPVLATPPSGALDLNLEPFVAAGELVNPVALAHAGDARLFAVERDGRIRVVTHEGTVLQAPFLDITDRVMVSGSSERGLLGLAFHPDYATNGYFYVNYTADPDGFTHVSRFQVTADPDVADPNSEAIILSVEQPYVNHNAGALAFGPDGYFYIPLGDGGSGNDPGRRAQDPQELLGKLLRIDVDGGAPYTIPPDNPYVGNHLIRDEIWAIGLRNPWRMSFDRVTGDLWVGDVGQFDWEEVDFQPAASAGGENYGWPCYEGDHRNPNIAPCEPITPYDPPVTEYTHAYGCAITGGYVYRGARFPLMMGRYFFTDYCTGYFWDLDGPQGPLTRHDNLQTFGYATFGEAADGELYVANINDGSIKHLTEATQYDEALFLPFIVK